MHLTKEERKKKKSAYILSYPYAKQKEMRPFISGGGGVGSLQTDVYKQKVTDKNPNTMLHCLPWFTDEPIGTTAKSLPGKHPEIKRCKQAA